MCAGRVAMAQERGSCKHCNSAVWAGSLLQAGAMLLNSTCRWFASFQAPTPLP